MNNKIIFDLDPVIVQIGSLELRYYGAIFAVMFWFGFFVWRYYMMRTKYTSDQALMFLPWFLGGFIIGARLGHCLFYEPVRYLSNPVTIFYFWKGGLSSHGATIGLLTGIYGYCKWYQMNYLDIVDRFAPSAAIGATAVRLGNFFNSEIVGRETDLPWAIKFIRYDEGAVARHPTQLYEFFLGIAVLIILLIADNKAKKEARPKGLITGVFAMAYFGGRFFIEFSKEFHRIDNGWVLTIGQWLCIPFFLFGIIFITLSKRRFAR